MKGDTELITDGLQFDGDNISTNHYLHKKKPGGEGSRVDYHTNHVRVVRKNIMTLLQVSFDTCYSVHFNGIKNGKRRNGGQFLKLKS